MAAARTLLLDEAVPLLTLTGPGGVGKTRLALAVASDLFDHFPDGVAVVFLAPVTDPGLVVATIAQAVGVQDGGDRPLADRIKLALRERRLLLVLDNFEHVISTAPFVADALTACPSLQILVTSRESLRVSGEHEIAVLPLALPAARQDLTPGQVAEAEAVRLFVDRARAVSFDFVLTSDNAPAVAGICRRLDGLPLAIELAAARTKALPPRVLLSRLQAGLSGLARGGPDLPVRQQTIRDTIAWSHNLLGPAERAVFRRLAVFVGGCGLDAAEAACQGAPVADATENLISLVDKSLLRAVEGPSGEPRYHMLETVREFALEALAASGEEESVRRRHAEWCERLAEAAGPDLVVGRNLKTWMARLDGELPNIRAALAWLLKSGDAVGALRIFGAASVYWTTRPYSGEVRRWLEDALIAADGAPTALRVAALHLAVCMAVAPSPAAVVAYAEQAVALAQELGDPLAICRAYYDLGIAWEDGGDFAKAAVANAAAVHAAREGEETDWLGLALSSLGYMRALLGEPDEAIPLIDEALAIHRRVGSTWGEAESLVHRGHAARAKHDPARAAHAYAQGIAVARDAGDDKIVVRALAGMAGVAIDLGALERAVVILGAAEAAREVSGQVTASDRLAAEARARLNEERFEAAWHAGQKLHLDEAVVEALAVEALAQPNRAEQMAVRDAHGLTRREQEVLALVAQRWTDPEIAANLSISPRTVEGHVAAIFNKLGVSSRRDAAALAAREELV